MSHALQQAILATTCMQLPLKLLKPLLLPAADDNLPSSDVLGHCSRAGLPASCVKHLQRMLDFNLSVQLTRAYPTAAERRRRLRPAPWGNRSRACLTWQTM